MFRLQGIFTDPNELAPTAARLALVLGSAAPPRPEPSTLRERELRDELARYKRENESLRRMLDEVTARAAAGMASIQHPG